MLLMMSDGLSSDALRSCLPSIAGKKAAIIPTAIASTKQRQASIPSVQEDLSRLGAGQCEIIDIVSQRPKALEQFDLLYFMGGNAFLLLKEIRARGYGDALRRFEEQGLILSSSGGALAFGQTIAHIDLLDTSMNKKYGLTDFTALSIAPVSICPHKRRFIEKYDRFLERIAAFETQTGQKIVLLEDGEGIYYAQGEWRYIRP